MFFLVSYNIFWIIWLGILTISGCFLAQKSPQKVSNKLAKARKMRKPGTLSLKKFGLGNLWVKKFGSKILAFFEYAFGKYTFGK